MNYFKNLLPIFFISLACITSGGQTINNYQKVDISSQTIGEDCESNNSFLDTFSMLLKKNPDEMLFVIAQRGMNENFSIVKRRLDYTKEVLLMKGFNDERMLFATRDRRIKGKGKLEFYIGSQLYLIINIKKNKRVCYLTPDYCGPKNELCK